MTAAPKVHCVRVPRPCGCSTPICAIFTGSDRDCVTIESHTRKVNQHCTGRQKGTSVVRRWLSPRDWVRKYTHTRNRRQLTEAIKLRCVELKEEDPRIPETYLL